ncbi:MAG TPA: hypothetical protein VN786_06725 [Acidimicrobiales bacterium]|nr:hypothetical protein [Acidimicrobiales bacterium]
MTDVLYLLAMWALLQVLIVWCVARCADLRALEMEAYRRERKISSVDSPPQRGCAASPYVSSNSDSTTIDTLENFDLWWLSLHRD